MKSSKESLTRAFSFKRVTSSSSSTATPNERASSISSSWKNESYPQAVNIKEESLDLNANEKDDSDWSESIGATASTAFNTILSPFESASESATNIVNSAQKHKHNLFAKLESHSLSISNALFGSNSTSSSPREIINNNSSSGNSGLNKQSSLQEDPFDDEDINEDMLASNITNTSNNEMEEALISHHSGSSTYLEIFFN